MEAHGSTPCTSESPSQVFRDVVAGGISTAAVSAVLNPIDVADYLALARSKADNG